MAVAIGEGNAPVPQKVIPANEQPKLTLIEPSKTKTVFLLRASRYFDESTGPATVARTKLPAPIAGRACREGDCDGGSYEVSDPRVRQLSFVGGARGMVEHDETSCEPLDGSPRAATGNESTARAVMSTAAVFEPLPNVRAPFIDRRGVAVAF
jgi:hypothetical protein